MQGKAVENPQKYYFQTILFKVHLGMRGANKLHRATLCMRMPKKKAAEVHFGGSFTLFFVG
jgi:hypothetical protein